MAEVLFEELEGAQHVVRAHADRVVYLSLSRRDGASEEQLERFDWTPEALQLHPVPEGVDWPYSDTGHYVREPTPADYVDATERWLRSVAARCSSGEAVVRFRLRLYGPKGTYITGAQYSAIRPAVAEPAAARTSELDLAIEKAGIRILAQIMQLADTQARTVAGVAELQNKAIARAADREREQEDRFVALAREFGAMRRAELESAAVLTAEERKAERRHRLASDAFDKLSRIGELALLREVDPKLVPVFRAVASNDELADALKRPELVRMLEDKETAKQLAAFLLAAAEAEARAKAEQQAPPPPTPGNDATTDQPADSAA